MRFVTKNKDLKIVMQFVQGNFLVYILMYLQNLLINTSLSPFDLGKYSYYQSLFVVILPVFSLTIYSSHLRFLGFVDVNRLLNLIRKVLAIASVMFGILALVVWAEWRFIPFAGFIWFNEQLYYFRSLSRIWLYSAMKFVQHIILICSFGILLLLQQANHEMLLFIMGLAYILTYAIFFRARQSCIIEQQTTEDYCRKEIFAYCVPGAVSIVAMYILSAGDQMFINVYLSSFDLADYAVAFRTLILIQLFTAFFMEYWPRFYFERAAKRNYSYIKKMGLGFKAAIASFSVACILFADPIYYIMGVKAYIGQSTWIFSMLVFGEIFRVFGSINMTYRSYSKESIYNVYILGGLGISKLAVNYLFVEQYGIAILVYTTVGCYVAYWIMSYLFSVRAEKRYMMG